MAIILEEIDGIKKRIELYSNLIRIHGNPVNDLDSIISMELQKLEYHNGELTHNTQLPSVIEPASDFVNRTFDLGDKIISGLDVMRVVKLYVAQLYSEQPQPDPEQE